ncbi:MAG TPA: phosphatidylinositol mannoside acyltransferase [Acidimicrobiales bacterium]|nr:phosphatidylinositol mannoside acyltransferase [Acidimicrobiales bacterium]
MASGHVRLFRSVARIIEALPQRVDVAVAESLARTIGPRGAKAGSLADNLRPVLDPDGPVDDALVELFVRRGFASYGRYWAEGAKLPAVRADEVVRRFVIAEGLEHLEAARDAGRGVILALPHVGSWEWGGALLAQLGMPMWAVAERLEPPELFEWFAAKREAMGIHVVPLDGRATGTLVGVLRAGGIVGLLCDRDLEGNGIEVEFFARRVSLPGGPATLALRTGAPILVAACYSGPGRDHHAVVLPPIVAERTGARLREDVARVTQRVADGLASLIRRAPEQWHVLPARFE